MILPDTSIWIDFLGRPKKAKSAWLVQQIERKKASIGICMPIMQEVLQGTSSDAHFGRVRKQLERFEWVDIPDAKLTAILAARLYAQLRWRGITVRSPNDCLIALIAIENDLLLLHDDADFDKIASVEPRLKLA